MNVRVEIFSFFFVTKDKKGQGRSDLTESQMNPLIRESFYLVQLGPILHFYYINNNEFLRTIKVNFLS